MLQDNKNIKIAQSIVLIFFHSLIFLLLEILVSFSGNISKKFYTKIIIEQKSLFLRDGVAIFYS